MGEYVQDMATYTVIATLDTKQLTGDSIWDIEEELYPQDEEYGDNKLFQDSKWVKGERKHAYRGGKS